ncbi:MAG: pyridoxal-phosphate dependent enzyme, partial [Candidatus Aminicenantes bacterium]|nr:pyridoxal-phosphate dependent enzyme [Candidatus Aminicenantes bacterium]
NSCIMYESLQAGYIIDKESLPTISDGTAGGIEKDTLTFAPCQEFVDDFILLNEDEIKSALRLILEKQHVLIEGAAALPVAASLKTYKELKDKNVVLILSGAKLSLSTLKSIL